MSKLAGLCAAHELLSISRTNCARHRLLSWTLHPDDLPHDERLVAYSLLLVEIEDHQHNLAGIAEACHHGLAGTVPDEHLLAPEDFDPWAVIAAYLSDEYRAPVQVLSPALLAWLEAWPERERRANAKLLELLGPDSVLFAHVPGEDGRLRRATDEEKQRQPETSMLATMECTFFAQTYAADLAEVAHLAAHPAPPARQLALARMLALVE